MPAPANELLQPVEATKIVELTDKEIDVISRLLMTCKRSHIGKVAIHTRHIKYYEGLLAGTHGHSYQNLQVDIDLQERRRVPLRNIIDKLDNLLQKIEIPK